MELHGEPHDLSAGSVDGALGGRSGSRPGALRLQIDNPRTPFGVERVEQVRIGFPAPRCGDGDQSSKPVEHLASDHMLSPFPLTSICSWLHDGSLDEGIERDELGRPTEIWWQRAARVRASQGVSFVSQYTKLLLWDAYEHTLDYGPDL